jgi:hypothetical protein
MLPPRNSREQRRGPGDDDVVVVVVPIQKSVKKIAVFVMQVHTQTVKKQTVIKEHM